MTQRETRKEDMAAQTSSRRISIPHTDLSVFPLCLGTADFGSLMDRKSSFALLDAYVGNGGNFLDTAKVYADWRPGELSVSEKTLGLWMNERRNRDRIVLATKGAHPDLRSSTQTPRVTPADIELDITGSLTNLRTDRIDLYWLHRDDLSRPVAEIIETLSDQVRTGRIRWFGCSNWRTPRIKAANEYAAKHGLQGFVANQMLWNLAVPDPNPIDPTTAAMDDEMWKYHRQTGLTAIPYSATACGFFHKLEQAALGQSGAEQRCSPENRKRFERARQLMAKTGFSMTQVVLGYLLSQSFMTIPIIGPHSAGRLLDSLTALDVRLKEQELAFLTSSQA
jgi:aryl-alcohol dehydrogenase-like predicted oxidoreductase